MFTLSQINKKLLKSIHPWGYEKSTLCPLLKSGTPTAPPIVVTTPVGVILRTVWEAVSHTYTSPLLGFTHKPKGPLNDAFVPVPSWEPATPTVPAKVVTIFIPSGEENSVFTFLN